MQTLKGTVIHEDISGGVWLLDTGKERYELKGGPPDLYQSGKVVSLKGTVRKDVMSIGMSGPVFEVKEVE